MDLLFKDLCNFFEAFRRVNRGSEKGSYLRNFVQDWKEKIKQHSNSEDERSYTFYSVLRLILPSFDRDRAPYGIKEYRFARVIIKMLCLPQGGADAVMLTGFRASATMQLNDFADAAYYVLRKYFTKSCDITITQVHSLLDVIADKNANNDPLGVEDALMELFKQCGSANLQKWIIRIILKDMRLGMGHKGILNALHPDAAELFANTNSLLDVCKLMYSDKRLTDIDVQVFKAFKPMLCKMCDPAAFIKDIPNNTVLHIENKFDGERFQLHMQDGRFRYFSRNGFDYTSQFGATYNEGIFTPRLKGVFKTNVTSIILDGEMMGYNKQTKIFGSKGMQFDVKTLTDNSKHQPCLCVFDILLLNEKVLTNEILETRVDILKNTVIEKEGILMLSKVQKSSNKEVILNALNASVDREEEGIVVKLPNTTYKPGSRSNYWWKIKLEFFEGHMTDLDLLILGGFYGDGRHHKNISSFLLGILDNSEGVEQFRAFARVASGLTDDELNVLHNKVSAFWLSNNFGSAKDSGILFGSQLPDVWIKPENSCVLEVRGSELIKTPHGMFTTEYTLRFPRILKVRTDKSYNEILSAEELAALTSENKPVLKLTKAHISLEDVENLFKVTRKGKKKTWNSEIVEEAEVKNDILKGYEFCVLTGTDEWPKQDVHKAILENGGAVVLTEGPNTFCLLVGNVHPKIKIFKNIKAKYDIVKLDWLSRVLENGSFFHYEPDDCVYIFDNSKVKRLFRHDRFGDSFTAPVTVSSVVKFLENVEKSGEYCVVHPSEDIYSKLFQHSNNLFPFSGCLAYFDKYEIICDKSSKCIYESFLDEMDFLFYGGEITDHLSKWVNVIVIGNESRRNTMKSYLGDSVVEIWTSGDLMQKVKRIFL